jgi:pilus assembly protein Flp/PilA
MLTYLRTRLRTGDDRGASAVEYGLLVAAIAAVIVVAAYTLGSTISGVFDGSVGDLTSSTSTTAG